MKHAKVIVAFLAGAYVFHVIGNAALRQAEANRLGQIDILSDIIDRFVEYADDDVVEKVGEETDFALKLAGIEMPTE